MTQAFISPKPPRAPCDCSWATEALKGEAGRSQDFLRSRERWTEAEPGGSVRGDSERRQGEPRGDREAVEETTEAAPAGRKGGPCGRTRSPGCGPGVTGEGTTVRKGRPTGETREAERGRVVRRERETEGAQEGEKDLRT